MTIKFKWHPEMNVPGGGVNLPSMTDDERKEIEKQIMDKMTSAGKFGLAKGTITIERTAASRFVPRFLSDPPDEGTDRLFRDLLW
jgi:hypothetical protein